jgi:hypothetical protein
MDGVRRVTKQYKSAKRLAEASVNLQLKTDCLYIFVSAADGKEVVIVDTTPEVGVVSGMTIWRYRVEPHPWAAEVAAIIWKLENDQLEFGTKKPTKAATTKGWVCRIHIQTEPDYDY